MKNIFIFPISNQYLLNTLICNPNQSNPMSSNDASPRIDASIDGKSWAELPVDPKPSSPSESQSDGFAVDLPGDDDYRDDCGECELVYEDSQDYVTLLDGEEAEMYGHFQIYRDAEGNHYLWADGGLLKNYVLLHHEINDGYHRSAWKVNHGMRHLNFDRPSWCFPAKTNGSPEEALALAKQVVERIFTDYPATSFGNFTRSRQTTRTTPKRQTQTRTQTQARSTLFESRDPQGGSKGTFRGMETHTFNVLFPVGNNPGACILDARGGKTIASVIGVDKERYTVVVRVPTSHGSITKELGFVAGRNWQVRGIEERHTVKWITLNN